MRFKGIKTNFSNWTHAWNILTWFPLVDGWWRAWGAYTTCTKSCGGGTKTRKRVCNGQLNGGKPCPGSAVEIVKCNTQACPRKFETFE